MTYLSSQARHALNLEKDRLLASLEGSHADLQLAVDAGDNSQNTDIFVVFEEQSSANARLKEIQRCLAEAEAATPPDGETISPGSLLGLRFDNGEEEQFIYGSVEEAAAWEHPVISPQSPIGTSIKGARVGDAVKAGAAIVHVSAVSKA